MSGVLLSYASVIFGEFYFGESKAPRGNSGNKVLNKVLVKIKHSTVFHSYLFRSRA